LEEFAGLATVEADPTSGGCGQAKLCAGEDYGRGAQAARRPVALASWVHPRRWGPQGVKLGIRLVAPGAAKGADDVAPNRVYSAREIRRRAAEPGAFHNFPESFNDEIFDRGTRTVTRGFFNQPRRGLSNDSVQYRLRGEINGRSGTYEIFARPSLSGRTEVIQHRFFHPDPR
jgi:hypothetical protein